MGTLLVICACVLQLKALLDGSFHSLDDFKADERYRLPHDDHKPHAKVCLPSPQERL
jgi:hypothetical protein